MSKEVKQNDNNSAIAYYRYSSHSQNEASIEQQREQAHLYAEKHGLTIIKEYEDKAISGTTDERPAFQNMLCEVGKLKPSTLIIWKTDRLARDKYIINCAKKKIRDAGCSIRCVAESIPDDSAEGVLIEGLLESMAEFYSKQLRQNVMRGMRYNAENALYNGRKTLGYAVDDTKHYIIDPVTAPIVQRIFMEYASGKPMADIAKGLNNSGLKTTKGGEFNINGLRHILKSRAYIGEYRYSDIVVENGMPRIITDELFEEVQKRFEANRHKAKQPVVAEVDEPRYWLTGKLYCGECGASLHGISGTSKTGAPHYYYACKNKRKHKCDLKNVPKQVIEAHVVKVLREFLSNTENLMSLAVDVSTYYKRLNADSTYLDSLKANLKEADKNIKQLMKFIESGRFSDTIADRIVELEAEKSNLQEVIKVEELKQALANDEHSIKKYFEMYAHATFDDEGTRNNILEYFIDKIYVFNDRLVVTWWYSDDKTEIGLVELVEVTDVDLGSTLSCSSPLERG